MPTRTNYTNFGARIRSAGNATLVAQKKAVTDAALILKRSIEQQTSIATKGSMGFSRMDTRVTRTGAVVSSRATSRLRVGYDLVGDTHPTALLVGRGPWGLIEYGSEPHIITPRMPTIQRKRVAALKYQRMVKQRRLDVAFNAVGAFSGLSPMNGAAGGGTPRYRVQHPGQKGKQPFKRGIEIARDVAARRARTLIGSEVIKTLRVNGTQYISVKGDMNPANDIKKFTDRL